MKDIAISTGVEGVDIPLAVVSENPRIIRREADLAEMGSNTARVAEDAQAAAEASKRAAIPKGANAKLQEKWNRIEGKISGKDLTASRADSRVGRRSRCVLSDYQPRPCRSDG